MDDKQLDRVLRQAEIIDDDIDDLMRTMKHIFDGYSKLGREIRKLGNKDLEDELFDSVSRTYQALSECFRELDMASVQDDIRIVYEDFIDEQ